jgi:hypothetical protein
MKFKINIQKTRAYLPIVVAEIKTETLTILAIDIVNDMDSRGQYTGFIKCTDVYGNLFSFPNSAVLRITTCFATKVHSNNTVLFIRHPSVYKWNGSEWIDKPSKLIFSGDAIIIESVWVYKNPEMY